MSFVFYTNDNKINIIYKYTIEKITKSFKNW